MGVNDPKQRSKAEVPTWNVFTPFRSNEIDADHEDGTDDFAEGDQQQAPSSIQTGRLILY
jgi:hypothetical protein